MIFSPETPLVQSWFLEGTLVVCCGQWLATGESMTIDLTGYAQGAYFVRIVGEQGTAVRKLIVK